MRILLLIFSAFACVGQTALDAPQAALVLDRAGALRSLNGISQNFLLGDVLRSDVVSFACLGTLCLFKTESSLTGPAGAVAVPPGPALISIAKSGVLVYFPSTSQFAWYRGGALELLDWDAGGEVLTIRASGKGAVIAVRRPDGIWIVRENGAILKSLPDGVAAVLFAGKRLLYSTASQLTIEQEDGSSLHFDVSGATTLRLLNERYVQVTAGDFDYILRLDAGHEQLSLLPQPLEVPQ